MLFVVIDQMRADCLHGALADAVDLPNLKALERDAVSFRNHWSVANPCGPSRASLLTGQYAMNHRSTRNGTPLPQDKPNVATEARKAGYLPLLFGYTDIAPDPRAHDPADPRLTSYEQVIPGFEEVVEMRLEESWPWRAHLIEKGYDVPPYPDIFRPNGPRPDDPALYRAEDSDTAFLTDSVIRHLKARPEGWFAHVTYIRPHPPLVAPDPYNRIVDPATLPLPERAGSMQDEGAKHPFNASALAKSPASGAVEGFPDLQPTDENIQMLRAIYLGLAVEVDHHIGRLVDALKETGQYDDTLIVVTSDHGEMLGDFHFWGKSNYHAAAYHVPLIIRDPDASETRGQAVSVPTESVDLAPTILDWMGRAAPDTMDGHSLLPFLQGHLPDGWRRHSFSELDFGDPVAPTRWQTDLGLRADEAGLCILRDGRYTLVHFNGGLPPLLFDADGAGEAVNIAARPEAQSDLLRLTRAMLDHRMRHAEGLFARVMVTPDGLQRGDF
ncbi:alkaline phosphatase family protein [Shimia biformata]|uniref:alkaline phosphatase family protein n=1 Tax=Shimia biformata TaxID=1294299 RepID=UPI0030842887